MSAKNQRLSEIWRVLTSSTEISKPTFAVYVVFVVRRMSQFIGIKRRVFRNVRKFVRMSLEKMVMMTSCWGVDQSECATRRMNQSDSTCVRKREASKLRHQVLVCGRWVYWMTLYFWLIIMAPLQLFWFVRMCVIVIEMQCVMQFERRKLRSTNAVRKKKTSMTWRWTHCIVNNVSDWLPLTSDVFPAQIQYHVTSDVK